MLETDPIMVIQSQDANVFTLASVLPVLSLVIRCSAVAAFQSGGRCSFRG